MIPYLVALSLIYPFWWAVTKLATLKQPKYGIRLLTHLRHRLLQASRVLGTKDRAREGQETAY